MVRLARRIKGSAVRPPFDETRLCDLVAGHGCTEVVSAAPSLSVLKCRWTAMHQLLDAVAPGGTAQQSLAAAAMQRSANLDCLTLECPRLDWGAHGAGIDC